MLTQPRAVLRICGFTTAGMVGVIAASHIIESLNLTQLGTVMDENFPAVALIQNEVPRTLFVCIRAMVLVSSLLKFSSIKNKTSLLDQPFSSGSELEVLIAHHHRWNSQARETNSWRRIVRCRSKRSGSQTTEVTRSSVNTTRCCIRNYRIPSQRRRSP